MIYFAENKNISSANTVFNSTIKAAKEIDFDVICYSDFDVEYAYILQRLKEGKTNFLVYCTLGNVAKPPFIGGITWKEHWMCTYEPRTNDHNPDLTFRKYEDLNPNF